mmetsp:Transcript_71151/g.206052  ORF Transcript_71151/g.206052 Transcript_71151/m.206052 type:complete len:334 (-) Transcript_71151:733-1734(-)
MPAPSLAPKSMSEVLLATFNPWRKIECQFSGGEPWKANVDAASLLRLWKHFSRSGAAETSKYCHSVPNSGIRCACLSGRSKARTDCEIHCTIGRTKALRCSMDLLHVTQAAPLQGVSSLTASTSRITCFSCEKRPEVLEERTGRQSPSTKSIGKGSKSNSKRLDFAARIAMQTRRSVTSAVELTPMASLIRLPNCAYCQQQISRLQTVRWIIGGEVWGSSQIAQYLCNEGIRKVTYLKSCDKRPSTDNASWKLSSRRLRASTTSCDSSAVRRSNRTRFGRLGDAAGQGLTQSFHPKDAAATADVSCIASARRCCKKFVMMRSNCFSGSKRESS